MNRKLMRASTAIAAAASLAGSALAGADDYAFEPVHAAVLFRLHAALLRAQRPHRG